MLIYCKVLVFNIGLCFLEVIFVVNLYSYFLIIIFVNVNYVVCGFKIVLVLVVWLCKWLVLVLCLCGSVEGL